MSDQGPLIRAIVGLGNPGGEYEETRHNAGFWLVDQLAREYGGDFRSDGKLHGSACRIAIQGRECWLLKPATFMNRSGQAVAALLNYYKIPPAQLLVAHDELDLPPGQLRLKQGGGHAGHNGLRDIIAALGGSDFWRLRLGIGHPGHAREVVGYVLRRPPATERAAVDDAIATAAGAIPQILKGDFAKVMNTLHRRGREDGAG
jgi:peptidyl-tRNA hydrolase, PTH1 family